MSSTRDLLFPLRMRSTCLLTILSSGFFVFSMHGHAQTSDAGGAANATAIVRGQVTLADGRPVGGARVTLTTEKRVRVREATSDADGRFRFADLAPGPYRIRVELDGFSEHEEAAEIRAGEEREIHLVVGLPPLKQKITVIATRNEERQEEVPVRVSVLSQEEIRTSRALGVDDLLKQVPSFSLFRRTSSLVAHPTTQGVSLRGLGGSGAGRSLVLLDDVPLNDAIGNWVHWSKIPPLEMERVEIAEGSLSPLFGGSALAGAIQIATREAGPKAFDVQIQGGQRGTAELETYGSREIGRLRAAMGGGVFHTGGYVLVSPESRGGVDTAATSQHARFNWRLEYPATGGVTLTQTGRLMREDRENGTPLQENSLREAFFSAGVRHAALGKTAWRAGVYSHLQTFRSSFTSVAANRATESLTLLQSVPSTDAGANGEWSRALPARQRITLGGDLRWVEGDQAETSFLPSGVNHQDRFVHAEQLNGGAFLEESFAPGRKWRLLAGLRADTWRNFSASRTDVSNILRTSNTVGLADSARTRLTPRAGGVYSPVASLTLRGAFYQGFRAPTWNELYRSFRVGNVQTEANENLGAERLIGGEAGLTHVINPHFLWRLTGFWNELSDTISNITVSQTAALITRRRQNVGRARVRGIDAEFESSFRARWKIAGHYLFHEGRIEESRPDPALVGKILPQLPKHRATLGLTYLNPAGISVRAQSRYESDRFDDDLNQLPLAGFLVLDVRAWRAVGDRCELFLNVENMLNRRYAVQATPVRLLGTPVMVTGGVRYRFAGR